MTISTSDHLTVAPNGSLLVLSLEKSDEGLYKCNVSNKIGSPLLKTLAVKVIGM